MTKQATSKLLLAAALAIPIFARAQVIAMTTEAAKAALSAAVERADDNARRTASTPVEFARGLAVDPYGAEGDMIRVEDKTLAGFMKALHKKADYWKAARDAFARESARIQDAKRAERSSAEKIIADARASVRLDRETRMAEALVADASKDITMVEKAWAAARDQEKDSDIFARKAEVYRQLQSLKTAP